MMDSDIEDALYEQLRQFSGVDIVWPGVGEQEPSEGYLRPTILPAITVAFDVAGRTDVARGVLQVSVFHPIGSGETPAKVIADQVVALFPRGSRLRSGSTRVEINSPAYLSATQFEPSWVHVPVNIPYAAFPHEGD